MDLTFLGTRGDIAKRTRRHRRHSALLVTVANARILLDCGADWLRRIDALQPTAIVLTHGHPDHASGLANGAPCPVYATDETWQLLAAYPITERRIMPQREPIDLSGVIFEAFAVEHSTRARPLQFEPRPAPPKKDDAGVVCNRGVQCASRCRPCGERRSQ